MDIQDEVKASKGDELPKSSLLPDSDENNLLKKPQFSSGVKGIDHVSPIKLKGTYNIDSPRSRRITMSERDMLVSSNPQPVSQFNPITGELIMASANAPVVSDKLTDLEKDKVNVGKDKALKHKALVKNPATVVYKARKQKTPVKKLAAIVEKPDAVVDKVSKHNAPAKKPDSVVVHDKDNVPAATESDKETEPVVVADVKVPVVAAVEKDNPKVTSKVSDESVKAPIVKESVKASSVVADKSSSMVANKVDVVKDNINVVVDKVVKENVLSVVVDKALNINVVAVADKASDALKNKPTGKGKKLVVGKDKNKPKNIVLDVVKEKFKPNPKQKFISSEIPEDDRKKKLKGKSKKDVSDSDLETDVVDYSFDEADRKRKKLKIKACLKRKRSGSNSSELDTKSIKRVISKLEKKVKKQEYDEGSVPKKGKKKLTKKVEKEESDEESVPKKGKKKLTMKVKKEESNEESVPKKEKQLTPEEATHKEYLLSFPSFHARTTPFSLFSAIRNSRVDILGFLMDIGFSSLHNVSIDHLPSKLDGVPFGGYSLFDLDEREADHEFVRKWVGQFYPLELKKVRVNDIARKLIAAQEIDFLFKVNFLTLFTNTMGKADGLKGQIYLDVVRRLREDSVISDIDWCGVMLEDYMRKASLKCPGDGKFVALHEKYVNLPKDLISLKDDGNGDNVGDDDDRNGDDNDVNDGDGNGDEEYVNEGDKDPNRSNPSFGFSKISLEDFGNDRGPAEKDKVVEGNPTEQGTGDLFGDNSATLEAMNQEITPEKLQTQKASPSPKKRDVKPSSYLLSPYMNKKTNVVPKITRLEFIFGNSLFAIVIKSKSHEIHSESHVIYYESHVIHYESHESCSNQVNAQFKGNKGSLALGGIDLSEHFYVVVFSLTKTTAMTILDNSPRTYDSKYKEVCDLLKKLFSRHLKQYGHIRHTQVAKVKHTIPKLKWETKENFHDCGIFTMLYMETFDGGPASNLDRGLPVES
uniref:Ulp1 protease family, C-terminal catalytic domain-containing protein n=1 Tax=Tanacetum cinerariifolium TaxID=118510 RepID=A0A6L2L6L9_TANCI|nr:hypothetical protein [Tanacetum cinerariifolium]